MAKNDEKWLTNYEALKAYIDEHHHLPDKHKVENRGLLNFSKYPLIGLNLMVVKCLLRVHQELLSFDSHVIEWAGRGHQRAC